jgi:hypothetical protein
MKFPAPSSKFQVMAFKPDWGMDELIRASFLTESQMKAPALFTTR